MIRYLRHTAVLLFVFLGAADQLHAQTPGNERPAQAGEDPGGVRFLMQKPPSLRFGEKARTDFRVKLHGDHRSFAPDLRRENRFDLRRLRVGAEGHVLKVVEYEVEYDFREDDYPLRDAFLNLRSARGVQIRAGKFKQPFSREELTGAMNLDFIFRSLRPQDQGAQVARRALRAD